MTNLKLTKYKPRRKIKVGDEFNRWTVLENMGIIKGKTHFKCECKCGTVKAVIGSSLSSCSTKSCGCLKTDTDRNKMFHDYTGERIGRLIILGQTEPISKNGGPKLRRWNIRCDCGVEKSLQTQTLRKQAKTGFGSCGCWSKERNRQKRLKHTKPYSFYLKRIKNSTNNRNKKRKNGSIKIDINYEDLIKLIPSNGIGVCHYCGEPLFWDKYEEPKGSSNRRAGHNFDRKDNSKGYKIGNLVPCCGDCNRTRGDRFTYEEFMLLTPMLKAIRNNRCKK